MQKFLYTCLKALIFVATLVPLKIAYIYSHFIYFLLVHVLKYRKKVVHDNLVLVYPNKTEEEITIIIKKFYRHLSELFVEILYLLYISEREMKKRAHFKNPELVNKYYSEGRHVVAVASHYSNWEWGNGFPLVCQHKLMEVYKVMNNKIFDKLFQDIRSRFGGIPVEISNVKPILAETRKTPVIAFLVADQSPASSKISLHTNFLGVSGTPVFEGPERIAKAVDAVFMFVDIQKVKRGYYTIEFITLCENSKQTNTNELTQLYINAVEQQIYNKPEYWMWSHRRWKRRKI